MAPRIKPGRNTERARGSVIESLAVLPLRDLSDNADQEYFADGITEALITDLGKINSLKVIFRTSVMHYKSGRATIPEIGRELGVQSILEGSVLRFGTQVRISVKLI
jgi:TolB-like protein